ncbi:MAG: hypothetical protein BWK78_09120 [Thiotrichaceae bacterium IS1]|nr:MAG: hypothetical protein BWK78_09120 [Thiotrichaceae bacterium IS1]
MKLSLRTLSPSMFIGLTLCFLHNTGLTDGMPVSEIRIGYQRYGTLIFVKARENLEKRLVPLGITIKWQEFVAGVEILEGFKNGDLDFGVVGETPPVFGQAADVPFVYIAYEPPSPQTEAILLPKNSLIQNLADLKGKRIAVHKGTNVHYLLLKALEKAKLGLNEVQIMYMPPYPAGWEALQNGSVEAWAIWDPILADAQLSLGAKILVDGQGLVPGHQFYLSRREFVDQNPKIIDLLMAEIARIGVGIKQYPKAAAKFLAPQTGIKVEVLETAFTRMNTGIQFIGPEVILVQQQIADTFYRVGLIPKRIKVSDAVKLMSPLTVK